MCPTSFPKVSTDLTFYISYFICFKFVLQEQIQSLHTECVRVPIFPYFVYNFPERFALY